MRARLEKFILVILFLISPPLYAAKKMSEAELQNQILSISEDRASLESEKIKMEADILIASNQLVQHSKELVQTKKYLQERIKALYKFGKAPELQFLFTNEPLDMVRNLKILKQITKRDLTLIKEFRDLIANIRFKRDQQEKRRDQLAGLEKELKLKENKLTLALDRLSELRKNPFLARRGNLTWPVQGGVAQKYGLQSSNDGDYYLFQRGLIIDSKKGSSVVAVAEGVITAAEFIPGLGLTVIVDHGDHFYSVYSGLEKSKWAIGDRVKESDVIGQSGILLQTEREGLYFEMRHYAQSMDPLKWMTTKEKSL